MSEARGGSGPAGPLTGRLGTGPSRVLHEEVLEPQFRLETQHLLGWYVAAEQTLLLEYRRMGLLTAEQAAAVQRLLITAEHAIVADPEANLSDVAFAVERHVESGLTEPVPNWHVDRSRNDLQACAQLAFGRDRLIGVAEQMLELCEVVREQAQAHREMPMPGYTQFQAAQVITPGFYLAAVAGELIHTLRRLLSTYDEIDYCPLGAGAMAGQDLPWDRDRMAALLGFRAPQAHSLTAVASRGWVGEITAELSLFGVIVSRFVTDLMSWGSSAYGFIDLPDELAGISSAMPQKKNFPVLERLRGRAAHLSSCHLDVLLGQRNTPYTNLVEVSKEAGSALYLALEHTRSLLRLSTLVTANLQFRAGPMRAACEREFLGGFSLANRLTLEEDVPWRQAQVLAGRYITAVVAAGRTAQDVDADQLQAVAEEMGHHLAEPGRLLVESFDLTRSLTKRTTGSVHPEAVADLLRTQAGQCAGLRQEWSRRRATTTAARSALEQALTVT